MILISNWAFYQEWHNKIVGRYQDFIEYDTCCNRIVRINILFENIRFSKHKSFFISFIYFILLKYHSIDLLPFNDANDDSEIPKAHYLTRSTLEQKSLQPETMTKAAN